MDYLNGNSKHLHFTALNMWANYLETGDPTMSADDACRCGWKGIIKELTPDQEKLVSRLRDEAGLTLQNGLQAKS
jgi:hypothetical protein